MPSDMADWLLNRFCQKLTIVRTNLKYPKSFATQLRSSPFRLALHRTFLYLDSTLRNDYKTYMVQKK